MITVAVVPATTASAATSHTEPVARRFRAAVRTASV